MDATDRSLADFVRPSSFWEPLRLVAPPSWAGHIPFAFWLVDALRPSTIVELGTHSGNSFGALCQAVRHLEIECSCVAIDTWKGDPQAGFYGPDVYEDLWGFISERYPFAELRRSRFDDAVGSFADGSIDLLHIDGSHDYESVRRDFETWLPKVSSRGVVIMHDIVVFDGTFGVHRLWGELSGRYPSFEFAHSHGLGVLGVGEELPSPVARLFEISAERDVAGLVRNAYTRLGNGVIDAFVARYQGSPEHLAELGAARAENADELHAAQIDVQRLTIELAAVQAELDRHRALVGRDEESYVDLKQRMWALRDHAIGAEATAGRAAAEVVRLGSELAQAKSVAEFERDSKRAVFDHLAELEKVREHRDAMYRSLTWRIGSAVVRPLSLVRRRAGGSGS